MFSAKEVLDNVRSAFRGEYVARDKKGVSYKKRYSEYDPPFGAKGFLEDKKNLALDMHATLNLYEKKKR